MYILNRLYCFGSNNILDSPNGENSMDGLKDPSIIWTG